MNTEEREMAEEFGSWCAQGIGEILKERSRFTASQLTAKMLEIEEVRLSESEFRCMKNEVKRNLENMVKGGYARRSNFYFAHYYSLNT